MGAVLTLALGLNAQTGRKATKTNQPFQAAIQNSNPSFPNRGCANGVPSEEWNTWFNQKVEEYKASLPNGKAQMVNYTIPVIVHVIHGGQAVGTYPNLAQGQINSQITVLNQDFAGTGFNSGNCPSVFASAKANTGITFCLATKDPNGNLLTEPGIDRINYVTKGWNNPAGAAYATPSAFQSYVDGTIKPGSIWDPTRYMNIWITDENSNTGLLGYATFPAGTGLTGLSGFGTATTDGLWFWSRAFGSKNIFTAGMGGVYSTGYDLGRTASHEIGHWVGLRHIGGDGTCATDYCADTPTQKGGFAGGQFGQNYGCPTHPYVATGECTGTTAEMFMNFMDYVDDACMYMFTNDQTTRIQTAMQNGTYRNQLSASATTLCNIPASAPVASMSIPSSACAGTAVAINNLSNGNPVPTYSWSSNPSTGVTFNPNSTATNPSVIFSTPGSYTLTVVATNSVGSNSNSKSITITTCSTAPTSCNDTLTNANATDTLFAYSLSGSSTGYVGGNNSYGDKEKAEFFAATGLAGTANITGGIVIFYRHATANIGTKGTGNVVFKIYGGNNTSGPTSTVLNSYTTSITNILASSTATGGVSYCGNPNLAYSTNVMRPFSFNFPSPTPITGGFFLSVQLPTSNGDTAAIFVTSENGRTASTAWELQTPATWVPFNDGTTTSWQLNAGLAILPKIACATGMNKNSALDNGISLYPNPTTGQLNIIATMNGSQNLDIEVYNTLGQKITSQKHNDISTGVLSLDLSHYANGIYFVSIDNGSEKIIKRVLVNK